MQKYGKRNGFFALRSPSERYKMDFEILPYGKYVLTDPWYDWVKPVMWYDLSHC